MELNDKQFIAAFNSGYLLMEFEPQMFASMLNGIKPMDSNISEMMPIQKEFELPKEKNPLK